MDSNSKTDKLWHYDPNDAESVKNVAAMQRMKKRIEKEVYKQEMKFHRMQ